MAFMRAVHEDPPIQPLFPSCYHFQSDELLGSWLILVANLPVVPYSLIYLSTARTNWVYMGALFVSIVLVFGTALFVKSCYPTDKVFLCGRYFGIGAERLGQYCHHHDDELQCQYHRVFYIIASLYSH